MSDGGSSRKGSKKSGSNNAPGVRREHELVNAKEQQVSGKSSKNNLPPFEGAGYDERQSFLIKNKLHSGAGATSKQAKLAKQETLEEQQQQETQALTDAPAAGGAWRRQQRQLQENPRGGGSCCSLMLLKMLKWKWAIIPLFIICCIAAIYCIPYIDIEARVPMSLPHIPFNYREGPLRASTASQFKIERLFADQISGPESVALDSLGNMYLAIEGGFILYAHLNKSSVPKRGYYINEPPNSLRNQQAFDMLSPDYTDLVKIAELNGIRQMPYGQHQQQRRWAAAAPMERTLEKRAGSWRRECLADEQIYGQPLHSGGTSENLPVVDNSVISDTSAAGRARKFVSNVHLSRCSKPLGVRLSPDESHLYVVDTLSGLYRVNLKNPERQFTTQRSVTKLLDFRANNRHQMVPVISLDEAPTIMGPAPLSPHLLTKSREHINISLMAVDDLAIDYGAGTNGGDMIYLSDASQNWQAISFVYDMLEGRPSGAILRYDTGINQLSVLSPTRVAHVRTSVLEFVDDDTNNNGQRLRPVNLSLNQNEDQGDIYLGLGAPRLDENDIFDDRPLHFPNGIELTDDKQAILIADTTNKRIIKHYIKGSRRGTSDLWAWTPHFPDNIRRGYDRNHETYWVVGCGEDTTSKPDILAWLQAWPRLRKYILKNIYLFGWLIESIGGQLLGSNSVRDFGYSLKIGNSLCESLCSGMMILQYNKHGDVIRSIYSKEFPNDITLYSQVNELIDAQNQEHVLYLSSPVYKYVTKLVLPSDSFVLSTSPS